MSRLSSYRLQISNISYLSFLRSLSKFFRIFSFSSSNLYFFTSNSFNLIRSSSVISSYGFFIHSSTSSFSSNGVSFFSSRVPDIISFTALIPESSFIKAAKRSSSFLRSASRLSLSSFDRYLSYFISLLLMVKIVSGFSKIFFCALNRDNGFFNSFIISAMRLFRSLIFSTSVYLYCIIFSKSTLNYFWMLNIILFKSIMMKLLI